MEIKDASIERISEANMLDLARWSRAANIHNDPLLQDLEDIRKRLILYKRKLEGCSYRWKNLFTSVLTEANSKGDALIDLMKPVEETFSKIPTDSLSEILRKEGHLSELNLLEELSLRIKALQERNSLIIIAGETNGGKSSFLNLLLGEDILPTDVLHCTFAICKIVYSKEYRVETLDNDGEVEVFPCASSAEAADILRKTVSQEDMRVRSRGSDIKEITLSLPADILKSGVTLVDTPGIGEDEQMDDVTMDYVRSTHASAFIYIIKSDTAGGVQEDRLIGFLRAIKNRYQSKAMVESFDPRAAMFVCHRWDNIEESQQEKVKKNALDNLAYVWPGFQASQTFFFSTKDALKHFSVDPEYVTDEFYTLLQGLKDLFDRASHNAIKHQYIWMKHIVPQASRHLRSMITHCIRSNEELERYFKSVAHKQEKLNLSSKVNSKHLEAQLHQKCQDLTKKVWEYLNFDTADPREEIPEFDDMVAECSQGNYLVSRDNRRRLDEQITRCLLKVVDNIVHQTDIIHNIEAEILHDIQDHLGLFTSQIKQIKRDLLHGQLVSTPSGSTSNLLDSETLGSSRDSSDTNSANASFDEFQGENTIDPVQLSQTVNGLLRKIKHGKFRHGYLHNTKPEERQSLFGRLKDKLVHQVAHRDPAAYVEDRIKKIACKMRQDNEILGNIVNGYMEWIQQCVSYATGSIPSFVEVNTKLMDEIREHRESFEKDKYLLKAVMEELEPSRDHLRGYGSLFMDDINADLLAFNVERRHSSVFTFPDFRLSAKRNDDSGFQGSGSKKRKVRSLWARIQGANIQVDDVAEKVVVKTYIYDMDDKLTLSEIASLRCLEDTNIAPFWGMTRILAEANTGTYDAELDSSDGSSQKFSAFIFRGDLVSARVYSKRKMTNLQEFVPGLIKSLLDGLKYIHREKLVHMELNCDTVMVEKTTGQVKLCQMCKPREARFPAQLEMKTNSCICLSPSVLQGNVYEATDDLYAFGLFLWELLFPETPPYRQQREMPLKEFIEKCHPVNMLQPDLMTLNASEEVMDVLKGTLLVTRGNLCMSVSTVQSETIIKLEDIADCLERIDDDPAVKSLRSRHNSFPFRAPGIFEPFPAGNENHDDINQHSQRSTKIASRSPTPTRPPRTKHEQRNRTNKSNSEATLQPPLDPSTDNFDRLNISYGCKEYRRGSLPPTLNYDKPKSGPFGRFRTFLKQHLPKRKTWSSSQQSIDHQKRSDSLPVVHIDDSWVHGTHRRTSSDVPAVRTGRGRRQSGSDEKRGSVPEVSLKVPKPRNAGSDNVDVPEAMQNSGPTQTPLGRTLPRHSPKMPRAGSLSKTGFYGSMPCIALASGAFSQDVIHNKRERSCSPKGHVRFGDQLSQEKQLSQTMPRPGYRERDFASRSSYPSYIGTIKEGNSNTSLSSKEDLMTDKERKCYLHSKARLNQGKSLDSSTDGTRRGSAPTIMKQVPEIRDPSLSPPLFSYQKNIKHPISPLALQNEAPSYLDVKKSVSPSSPRRSMDSGHSSLDNSFSSSRKGPTKPIFYQSNPPSPEVVDTQYQSEVFNQWENDHVSQTGKDYLDASEPQLNKHGFETDQTKARAASDATGYQSSFARKDHFSWETSYTDGVPSNETSMELPAVSAKSEMVSNDTSHNSTRNGESSQAHVRNGVSMKRPDEETNEESEYRVHDFLEKQDDFGTAVGNNSVPLPPPVDILTFNFD